MRILARLAKVSGTPEFLSDSSVTMMKTDGFSNWTRVSTSAWVLNQFFEFDVRVASLFDRDYRSDPEIEEFVGNLKNSEVLCFVLPFKEIENVLLVPEAIKSAVEKNAQKKLPDSWRSRIDDIYSSTIESFKEPTSIKTASKFVEFEMSARPKSDLPSIMDKAMHTFSTNWKNPDFRRSKVPGKEVFSNIAKAVQEEFGVTLTDARVINELQPSDIPQAVREILISFENFFRD
ncbi:hypothetical protein ASF91_15685 [Rhizobium sp. Leaf155]|nr:hypothetical protein ASF91_15685 [Rhizobium sp. Leaf155]